MSVPFQNSALPPEAGKIDFGWIKQAWALFTAQSGIWVGAMLLAFLIDTAAWVLLAIPTGVFATMRQGIVSALAFQRPAVSAHPYQEVAQGLLLGILAGWVIAVFNGGFYRMALRQKRGQAISVADLFSGFPQALPLLVVASVVPAALGVVEGIGLWLLHFSMTPAAAIALVSKVIQVPAWVLPGLFMFAPLLIVDAGANINDALLGSLRLLRSRWLMGIVFYVTLSLLTLVGAFLCGVGLLMTCPLFFLSIATGYLALTQSPVDEPAPFDPAPVGVWPPPPTLSPARPVPEPERKDL